MSSTFQDSLLISTYTNDLAIVPDLFSSYTQSRKRGKPFEEDPLDLLYEQSGPKKHCSFPSYLNYTAPFDLMQKDKAFNTVSFVSKPVNQCLNVNQQKVKLTITEEPEQFYRARYDSEGVRAPLKGIGENYPTVEITGEGVKSAVVTVKLVHEDGSTHSCCSLDSTDDRRKALTKRVAPSNKVMRAEFEDLRIRREKRKEGRKSASGVDKSRDIKYDKMAYLLFTAEVDTSYGRLTITTLSSPISLTAAPEPAELDWLVPTRGHFGGKEVVAIKGSKMTSPKVLFRLRGVNGETVELPGTVDKEKSHQNVLLVRTPIIDHLSYGLGHQRIEAQVVVITGRNQMCSNSLDFEFIPNDICRECMQETPAMKVMPTSAPLPMAMPPCSPIPSPAPLQLSPQPVYSPTYTVQMSPPTSQSPYEQLPPVQTLTASVETPLQYDSYCSSPQELDNKDKDILQIVEHLLSPVAATCGDQTYSDVLPLYSTCSNPSSPPAPPETITRIEEALTALRNEGRIAPADYMFYMNECGRYNVDLLKAYSSANGDLFTFQQQLACIKPPISIQSIHT